jgi:GNAT superfamily N-acetyltransferase
MGHLFERLAAKVLPPLQARCGLQVCRVVARPLATAAARQGPDGIVFQLASEAQLLPHCAEAELELSQRHVREAFARGELCVAAFHGSKLVGYQWLAFRPTPHVGGVWVEFDQRSRYSYKKFVRPDYRGQRIALGLSTHADQLCRERGRATTVGFIRLDNAASWHASARLGSRTVGYAGYIAFASRFLAFRSPGARSWGFRFYKPALPAARGAQQRQAVPRLR